MPESETRIVIPLAAIDSSACRTMPKAELAEAGTLQVDAAGYRVVSYSLTTIVNGWVLQFNSRDDSLTPEIRVLIRELEPGKVLFFENILLRKPDGSEAVIPWFIVRVK